MKEEPSSLPRKAVLQTTGFITLITMMGYPLGYVRDMFLMKTFGAGHETDAWMIASQIPEILFKFLLFGALGASFIPVFTEFLMQQKEEEAWEIASTVINFTLLALGAVTLMGIMGAPVFISIFSPGFSQETKDLATELTRIVFPLILILGASGLITGIYNAYLKFTLPAATSLLGPVVVILFLIFFSEHLGIYSLAYGMIVGTLMSLFLLVIFFSDMKMPYMLKMNLRHPAIKNIMILMIPLMGADLISKGGAVIWRMFASYLQEGSITSLTLANRLVSIPIILFSSAAATVIFPMLSRHSAQKNLPEFKDTLHFGMRMMSLILLPAMVGLMVLSEPIVRLLFERGLFDASNTRSTAAVLFYSSLGLLAFGINPILYKACHAMKKNWYLFKYEVIGLLLSVPLLYLFLQVMGLTGIALASVLVRIALVLYLGGVISKEMGGLDLKSLSGTFYKSLLSSAFMGGTCYAIFTVLTNILDSTLFIHQIIQVGVSVVSGMALYMGLLFLLKVDGTDTLREIMMRKMSSYYPLIPR